MSKNKEFNPELISKAFDAEQTEVILGLHKEIDSRAEVKAKEILSGMGLKEEDLSLSKRDKNLVADNKRLDGLMKAWKNNGYVDGCKDRLSVADMLQKDLTFTKQMRDAFSTDHPLLVPRVVSNIAREAIEPNLVLTPLLSRINYQAGTQVVFPSWGAIAAADIAEGAEYPERSLELSGTVTCTIGKSGVALKITEEMVRYSQFDIMSMHIRAAGRAMARWKEQKVANLIIDNGSVIMYGTNSSGATTRRSTGRDGRGAWNGTLTLDDLFYCYATMVNAGFTPNTLIMHPFAWKIFAQEGIARAFGFINGMNPLMWQTAKGSVGSAPSWRGPQLNNSTYVSSPQQLATTFTNVPSIFPTNFNIIVSPYMPFTGTGTDNTSYTSIVFCDINELGVLVADEELRTEEWNDPSKDIMKIKFRERYGLAVMNEGRGIGILENIVIARSYDFSDKIALSFGTGDLTNFITGDNY